MNEVLYQWDTKRQRQVDACYILQNSAPHPTLHHFVSSSFPLNINFCITGTLWLSHTGTQITAVTHYATDLCGVRREAWRMKRKGERETNSVQHCKTLSKELKHEIRSCSLNHKLHFILYLSYIHPYCNVWIQFH